MWIPAHVDIQGNENVDKLVKAALNATSSSGKLICQSNLKPQIFQTRSGQVILDDSSLASGCDNFIVSTTDASFISKMAAVGRSWAVHFLVLCFCLLCIWQNKFQVKGQQEFVGTCELRIDLLNNNYQSGILRMALPESMENYQDPRIDRKCDVTINFSSGTNLLVELYYLDIIPDNDGRGSCTTGLEVLDQSQKNIYGQRLCMEAWEWEERHAQSKREKKIVQSSPLIFRLVSEGPYRGEGFKVHFNQFRPQYPCSNREFQCVELARCVHDDLTCDGWDDCGDHSDEEREAGCDLLTPSEICAVVMGCLLFLGTVISTILFCLAYRRLRRDYGLVRDHSERSESKVPLGMDPVLYKRYNSQESMGTHYSKTTGGGRTRRDSDSSVEKMDLEKLDRLTMDNGSERSYRSNPKSKVRSLALGSDTASETPRKTGQYTYNGGRRGRVQSSNSLNKGEAPLKINGIDNPAVSEPPRDSVERDRGRMTPDRRSAGSRRRGRDDYSDYSDEDDDSRRRRRRSRDRRSRRYSDEDDYDSDYDRDRRRRRRRRSYSDDDYDSYDSEYERERRRRRRSKERQRRSRERNEEYPDKGDKENGESKDEPRRRRDSRERDRERDSYDSEEEDRRRRRRRSPSYDDDDDYSRDRRRRRRSRSYDDDDDDFRDRRRRRRSRSYDDDDDDIDRDRRRRRSNERRRDPSGDRSRYSPDRDHTDAPKNAERMSRALAKELESKVSKREADRQSPTAPPPSSFKPVPPKEESPPPPFNTKEDKPPLNSSNHRAATPPPARYPSPPPPQREPSPAPPTHYPSPPSPANVPSPPHPATVKQPSGRSYHPPPPQQKQQRLPPVSPPPSGEEIRQMEMERERRKQQLHQQRIQRHQNPQAPSPPSSTSAAPEENGDRRRNQDNRRERYSRDRFRQRERRSEPQHSSVPPDYEDVYPRVRLDAPLSGYREETV
ncbi:hypothetical protein PoB_005025200 [Plakobranchus ocellatus]|uniref:RNase H type-1 domain-containing protein n=1 Tax=Plakobranchus ocellatus TaxID=259542 RepID=A0AAV4BXD3_9GAST|nr:hypothetical protein PoB_005025200 [Plakobranchus ocellatus]